MCGYLLATLHHKNNVNLVLHAQTFKTSVMGGFGRHIVLIVVPPLLSSQERN